MEFSSNSHSNPASSLPSPVATLRADGKPNTQAIIAANVQHLIAQLEAGHSEVLTQYLTTMARFHKYSLGNVLLIASQKPEASNVAGIFTWNQLGRKVKKGEKGIMIFAPMIAKKRRQKTSEEREESDSKTTAGPTLVGFRPVYVWDVSQTEGKSFPPCASSAARPESIWRSWSNSSPGAASSSATRKTSPRRAVCPKAAASSYCPT